MVQLKTVRKGERFAVWDLNGKVRVVDGPKRLLLLTETIEPLKRYTAEPDEYLALAYKDGRRKHIRGPAEAWFDPVEHVDIKIQKAININAKEALVAYAQDADKVNRKVITGPALYMPTENEWIHRFQWHGADPKNSQRKIPSALTFDKLRTIPDQMYFDVDDVRTADDALIVVKLMIFFELKDINLMLDQTHDPVADFINAVTADIIDFAAGLPFEKFKEETEKLNDLVTYKALVQRAVKIGYQINKVVYRGYYASKELQAMHDNAIETRTKLHLEAETERQAQAIADMKLKCEAERAEKRQDMEEQEVKHKNQLAELEHAELIRQKRSEAAVELEGARAKNAIVLEKRKAANQEDREFLGAIKGLGTDMTRYLVARYQTPDKLIRIDGAAKPQFHVHEE